MPDNEEPTTELPPVQPAPVAAVAPPVVVTPAPAVAEHKGHSTMKVLLAAGAGALVVFLIAAAGIIGFLPFWRRKMSLEPFSTLNKIIYSPACVLIAEGFFSLITPRF